MGSSIVLGPGRYLGRFASTGGEQNPQNQKSVLQKWESSYKMVFMPAGLTFLNIILFMYLRKRGYGKEEQK